jgi:hypothetical protein
MFNYVARHSDAGINIHILRIPGIRMPAYPLLGSAECTGGKWGQPWDCPKTQSRNFTLQQK